MHSATVGGTPPSVASGELLVVENLTVRTLLVGHIGGLGASRNDLGAAKCGVLDLRTPIAFDLEGVRLGRPRRMLESARRRIQQEHEQGKSLSAIAAGLNESGVPTAHGGALWYASTVRTALRRA